MIRLENITVTYGKAASKLDALKQVNLTINDGEFVTITGKSGCGKTTLLNVIGGILKPSIGEYYFDEKNVGKFTDSEMARLRNHLHREGRPEGQRGYCRVPRTLYRERRILQPPRSL